MAGGRNVTDEKSANVFQQFCRSYGGNLGQHYESVELRRRDDYEMKPYFDIAQALHLYHGAKNRNGNNLDVAFGMINNPNPNAIVGKRVGKYCLAIFGGQFIAINALAYRIFSSRELFTEIGDPRKESEIIKPRHNAMGLEYPWFTRPDGIVDLSPIKPRCIDRLTYAHILIDALGSFILWHEASHILLGHTDYFREECGLDILEEVDLVESDEAQSARLFAELEADQSSMISLFLSHLYREHPIDDHATHTGYKQILGLVWFGLIMLACTWHANSIGRRRSNIPGTHPLPESRMAQMVAAPRGAWSELAPHLAEVISDGYQYGREQFGRLLQTESDYLQILSVIDPLDERKCMTLLEQNQLRIGQCRYDQIIANKYGFDSDPQRAKELGVTLFDSRRHLARFVRN
jgi:hypothetical protein